MTEDVKITVEILREWDACKSGFDRFCELFPDGADLKTAAEGLANDGHENWAIWLYDHARKDERFKSQALEGFENAGDENAGHRNAGHQNEGHRNEGDWNEGHWNAGDWNAGHRNAGDQNAGHRNAGHRNAGDWNA